MASNYRALDIAQPQIDYARLGWSQNEHILGTRGNYASPKWVKAGVLTANKVSYSANLALFDKVSREGHAARLVTGLSLITSLYLITSLAIMAASSL